MLRQIAAALAFAAQAPATTPTIPDLGTAAPIAGDWTYSATAEGSEAVFANAVGYRQLWVRCTRASRRVSIVKTAAAAVPFVNIWTSSLTRSVPPSFDPATGRLAIELANYDPLLDALANSRGRIGFSVTGQPPLVVPAWAEVAHVIEDCRA